MAPRMETPPLHSGLLKVLTMTKLITAILVLTLCTVARAQTILTLHSGTEGQTFTNSTVWSPLNTSLSVNGVECVRRVTWGGSGWGAHYITSVFFELPTGQRFVAPTITAEWSAQDCLRIDGQYGSSLDGSTFTCRYNGEYYGSCRISNHDNLPSRSGWLFGWYDQIPDFYGVFWGRSEGYLIFGPDPSVFSLADCNGDLQVSVQDIFDYLGLFFSANPRADCNNSGLTDVRDLTDFLALWFRAS